MVTFIWWLCVEKHTRKQYYQRQQLIIVFSSRIYSMLLRIRFYLTSWLSFHSAFQTLTIFVVTRLLFFFFLFLLCSCNFWLEAHASLIPAFGCLIPCSNQRITQTYFDCYWSHKTSAHAITTAVFVCMYQCFIKFIFCGCRNFEHWFKLIVASKCKMPLTHI